MFFFFYWLIENTCDPINKMSFFFVIIYLRGSKFSFFDQDMNLTAPVQVPRVSDPYPNWIRIGWVAGSGSKYWVPVRIRIHVVKKELIWKNSNRKTFKRSFYYYFFHDLKTTKFVQHFKIDKKIQKVRYLPTKLNIFFIKFWSKIEPCIRIRIRIYFKCWIRIHAGTGTTQYGNKVSHMGAYRYLRRAAFFWLLYPD